MSQNMTHRMSQFGTPEYTRNPVCAIRTHQNGQNCTPEYTLINSSFGTRWNPYFWPQNGTQNIPPIRDALKWSKIWPQKRTKPQEMPGNDHRTGQNVTEYVQNRTELHQNSQKLTTNHTKWQENHTELIEIHGNP